MSATRYDAGSLSQRQLALLSYHGEPTKWAQNSDWQEQRSGFEGRAELIRARGRLSFVTWSGELPVKRITGKGLDIHGCWHWNHDRFGEAMMQRVGDARPLLDTLTTHRFGMGDVEKAFALQESGACGKVLLYPAGVSQDEGERRSQLEGAS